jgi:transposase
MSRPPVKPVEEKLRIVLAVLRAEVSIKQAARRERVSKTSIAAWRDQFLDGGRAALAGGARHGPSTREQDLQAQIDELTSALGGAHVELRVWRKGGPPTQLRGPRGDPRRRRVERDPHVPAAGHAQGELVSVAGRGRR